MEGKKCKHQEKLRVRENPCQSQEDASARNRQLGQWQWTIGLWQPQEIQRERRGSKRTNETPQDTWLGKKASGSATQGLWREDRKVGSQVIGEDRSRLPGREQLEKLGKEEAEPATE